MSKLRTDTKRDALDEDFLLRLKTADRLVAEISRIEASADSRAGKSKPGDPDRPRQIKELSNRLRSVCRHSGAGRSCPLSKILCHVRTLFMKLKV